MTTTTLNQQEASKQASQQSAKTPEKPTIGRIVHYRLTSSDAEIINNRRSDLPGHMGNRSHEGDQLPMIVVNAHSFTSVNGQVFLDGNDTLWATSIQQGDGTGQWNWPTRS